MRNLLLFMLTLLCTTQAQAQTCNAAASATVSGNVVTLTNTSTPTASTGIYTYYRIYWGDGSTPTSATTNAAQVHSYTIGGTYTIVLMQSVLDSTQTPSTQCNDSVWLNVTVTGKPCAVSFVDSFLGNNTWRFTAINLNGTTGLTYSWDYGDGNTGSGSPVTHTYATNGSYPVTLTSTNGTCSDSVVKVVNISSQPCSVTINKTNNGNNNWTFTANNVNSVPNMTYTWSYGDGNTGTGSPVSHTYATGGNYTVMLIGNGNGCVDSTTTTVNIANPPNYISGNLIVDSTSSVDSYMVWLITYDSATNILAAVDSMVAATFAGGGMYYFNNPVPGQYRTKAALYNGATSGTGHVPTYHTSSLMWNTATIINHTGGATSGKNITMQTGTLTSGPGFIGGNVNQGANKGTANGIAGLNVFLVDGTGNVIAFTETDANGAYSFSNIPVGAYSVAPENLNYATTPAMLNITASKPNVTGMNFERSHSAKTIVPVASGIANVANTGLEYAIFPNPAIDVVTISWNKQANANANISITDISGKTIYSSTSAMSANATIDVSALQAGLYFLNVSSDAGSSTQKLTIQ